MERFIGQTFVKVEKIKTKYDEDEIHFYTTDGRHYKMYHEQDCCESVIIEDICGSLDNIIGSPILIARETSDQLTQLHDGTATWTFYNIATIKGYVTIRWYGESNGYYSESITIEEVLYVNQ